MRQAPVKFDQLLPKITIHEYILDNIGDGCNHPTEFWFATIIKMGVRQVRSP